MFVSNRWHQLSKYKELPYRIWRSYWAYSLFLFRSLSFLCHFSLSLSLSLLIFLSFLLMILYISTISRSLLSYSLLLCSPFSFLLSISFFTFSFSLSFLSRFSLFLSIPSHFPLLILCFSAIPLSLHLLPSLLSFFTLFFSLPSIVFLPLSLLFILYTATLLCAFLTWLNHDLHCLSVFTSCYYSVVYFGNSFCLFLLPFYADGKVSAGRPDSTDLEVQKIQAGSPCPSLAVTEGDYGETAICTSRSTLER